MSERNDGTTSTKKPTGARPLKGRMLSGESPRSQGTIDSGPSSFNASSSPGERSLGRHSRVGSKTSTLRLVDTSASQRGSGSGDEPWLGREQFRSPDSEPEQFLHSQPETRASSIMAGPPGRSRQGSHKPFASEASSRTNTVDLSEHIPRAPRTRPSMAHTASSPSEDMSSLAYLDGPPEKTGTSSRTFFRNAITPTRPSSPWSDKPTVESPDSENDPFAFPSNVTPPQSKSSPKRPWAVLSPRSRSGSPSRTDASQPIPPVSPSKARWDHLRQHVLPLSPTTIGPPPPAPAAHLTSPPPILPSARAQAPKQSRFARLGFRQVVEHVREVTVVDHSQVFAEDVLRACWQSRFPEPVKGSKVDQVASFNTGVSNANTGPRKQEPRRPESIHSLAMSSGQTPSVKYIHAMLLHYATPSHGQPAVASWLPHETQIIASLLTPFTARTSGTRADEERWFSIESYEIAVKTWKPAGIQFGVDRCLWCCKAAAMAPDALRMRILSSLSALLLSGKAVKLTTPGAVLSLSQGLFSLLSSLAFLSYQSAEVTLVNELIRAVQAAECVDLIPQILEKEYQFAPSDDDDLGSVTHALVLTGIGNFLEHGAEASRRWVLRYSVEEYWNEPQVSFTPLLGHIHLRKLCIFSRGLLSLLNSRSGDPRIARVDASVVIRLLRDRMIPEVEAASGPDGNGADAMAHLIRVVLELLCIDDSKEIANWASSTVVYWYHDRSEWKVGFENKVQQLIIEGDWPTTLRILSALVKLLPDDVRKLVVSSFLPALNDQLVAEPPARPCLPMTGLLDDISHIYPQLFYKPLFACAASAKELTVQNHLSILTITARFLPDFWTRDPEMVSVALMSEGSNKAQPAGQTVGKARLGQCALLVELIASAQALRKAEAATSQPGPSHTAAVKFFAVLETRIGILLNAKEKTVLVPLSQRALFCAFFLEIRMLTRSLKIASWLPNIIDWLGHRTNAGHRDANADSADGDGSEFEITVDKLEMLYVSAQNSFRESHKRRSTMMLSLNADKLVGNERNTDIIELFDLRFTFLTSLGNGFRYYILHLLVAVYGMLSQEDYRKMGPFLWYQCLVDIEPRAGLFACFLTMQCAEKTSDDFLRIVENDIHSSASNARLQCMRKISTLFNWRFQLLSQNVVTDRTHRRPFKLARGPLAFVATDIGSSQFVLEEDVSQSKDALPLELRKRLAEIGWAEEDEIADQQQEWTRTPMSLLPSTELDLAGDVAPTMQASSSTPLASPLASPMKTPSSPSKGGDLARSKSSSSRHFHGVKRRSVFVPSLSAIFPQLSVLVYDPDFAVATAARDTILDLMRNDPALLTRPIFDLLTEGTDTFAAAITSFRALEHVAQILPPAMAHHVFNHLAGFLKYVAKNVETPYALGAFANTVPTLARIVTQVSDMSIREIRRAKVEIFLVPSGCLWFPSTSPAGPMFPRIYGPPDNSFESAPSHLVDITMIRLSQNMLFLAMLKRNPQDVQMIRKNLARLVLPSREDKGEAKPLKLHDFMPCKAGSQRRASSSADANLLGLSLMISRSYLLLVAQIFRSMSRHLNDRNELAVLIDGLNRVLLAHGDDIGIVSQALIALMVASTRFRRLFTSGGGYTLFMPALVKIYTECEQHSGIKLAIEYAVNRFYALHQEGFIFQSLDIIAHVMMAHDIDQSWIARSVYTLFSTLRRGVAHTTPDAAGIHDSNKSQEREALIVRTAEDKPQTFLASLRKGSKGTEAVVANLPEEYEAKRLALDDFVRLFLTVIAHDPTILRGQHFLRFLRYLTPHLYHTSNSARSVLRDGIDALGTVLIKAAAKAKAPESALLHSMDDLGFENPSHEAVLENQLLGKSKTPSDIGAMRLDYLSMIVAFTTVGGTLPSSTSQKIVDLVKSMLTQSADENKGPIAQFFSEYTRTSLLRDPAPTLKEVVTFFGQLAPIVGTYASVVDFSGVFDTITQLAEDPLYANEPTFSRLVSSQICSAAISACGSAATEKTLLSMPSRPSTIRLMAAAIFLRGADVMAELEKHHASYELLIGIILPLVMVLKTTSDVVSDGHWTDSWRRDVHARTWTRLLTYLMSACQKKENIRDAPAGPERTRTQTQDKRRMMPSSKARMMTLVAAIQIIKTIIVRAEEDLSAHLPGIWSRIGSFIKSILADGDATFALTSQDNSAPSSPVPTPRGSTHFPTMSPSVFGGVSTHVSLAKPRVIDYCMWSMFELLCLCRTPLVIQMRLFIQEKVVILDQELRYHQSAGGLGRPRSRRISSGMFSKPRRRMSGYLSGATSLENSPTLGASPSFPSDPSLFHLDPFRQAGFERSASSSPGGMSDSSGPGPRIVHLGPVHASSASAFRRSISPSGGGVVMNKTATIKSVSLAMETYRRIRLVQTCMGYEGLLPLPSIGNDVFEVDEDPANANAWSKKQAVAALVREIRELMVEFEDPWREVEDDVVLIDADQSANF